MNRQSFDFSTSNGRKHFQKLLHSLLDYNSDGDERYFNDIHIYQEESLAIIEWDTIPYSGEWGGKWHFLDYDEVIMKEVNFPDNHYEYVFPEDVEERLSKLPSKCNNFITIGMEQSGVLKNSYEKQEQLIFKDEINYNIINESN